jgi:hypothetical protein
VPILILTPGVSDLATLETQTPRPTNVHVRWCYCTSSARGNWGVGSPLKLFESVLPKPSAVIATPVDLEETGVSESSKERRRMLGPSALVGAGDAVSIEVDSERSPRTVRCITRPEKARQLAVDVNEGQR